MNSSMYVALRAAPVEAQYGVTDIADEFYEDWATEQSGRYWWWIRMILLEPDELIVDDGADNLFRVPWTVADGADEDNEGGPNIVFGDPVPVRVEYIDIAARSEAVVAACAGISAARGTKRVAAVFEHPARTQVGASPGETDEGGKMKDKIAKLRARLGLGADVSDEDVLTAALEASPETPAPAPATGDEPEVEVKPEVEPEPEPEPTEARSVLVDAGALKQLQDDSKAGREARETQLLAGDVTKVDGAIKVGKIPSKARASLLAECKRDRAGTYAYLDELAENVIPVTLRGETDGGTTEVAASGERDTWLAAHMPDVARRKAALAANGHQPFRVMTDGAKLPAGSGFDA